MNFFEMLVVSRRLSFGTGRIMLYDHAVAIFPLPGLIEYLAKVNASAETTKSLYHTAKTSIVENRQNYAKAYKPSDGANWICNTINLYGLGKIKYENPAKAPAGVIIVEKSQVGTELKGRIKGPADHVLRGLIAGIASSVSQTDLDAIETECYVDGKDECRIVLDTDENLKSWLPLLYKQQL